jgi:predicted nuclease with RNAse H fold
VKALGVDLPWSESGEAAVARVDAEGWATWDLCDYPEGLIQQVREESQALILLDIPIHGLANLGRAHFRPIDQALGKVGLAVRPSSSASHLGSRLAGRLREEAGLAPHQIVEIYPYAVYKVLSYLTSRRRARRLSEARYLPSLETDFISYYPIPYKRTSARGTRRQGMEALYRTLTDPDIGLRYRRALPLPGGALSLKRCADVYDSLLGAVLGFHLLRNSPWAVLKGTESRGNMALLADPWLAERIDYYLGLDPEGY